VMKKHEQKFSAAEFPHLQEFVRGYLHQDLVPEYGNPHQAALAYLADLPKQDHAAVSAEAMQMRAAVQHWTTEQLNRELAKLGAAWSFVSSDEFLEILHTFERGH
jgi:hypothetical protein